MKTIKWIDILIKIAKGEEVPKKIKWNNLAYNYQILLYDKEEKEYVYENDKDQFCDVPNHHLNDEVEIIEENKNIEHIEHLNMRGGTIHALRSELQETYVIFETKLNEIIDRLNGEENGRNI